MSALCWISQVYVEFFPVGMYVSLIRVGIEYRILFFFCEQGNKSSSVSECILRVPKWVASTDVEIKYLKLSVAANQQYCPRFAKFK